VIIRRKHKGNFTIVPNAIFNDDRLSLEARGLLGFLLSRPPNWEIRHDVLRRKFALSRDRLARILNELISAGYLIRDPEQPRDHHMRFASYAYEVHDVPVLSSAAGSPCSPRRRRKSDSDNKKEEIKNSNNNSSPKSPPPAQAASAQVFRDKYTDFGRRALAADMRPVFAGSAPFQAWLKYRGPDGMPPVDEATIEGRRRQLVWLPSIYPPVRVTGAPDDDTGRATGWGRRAAIRVFGIFFLRLGEGGAVRIDHLESKGALKL
jgi:hypothetical protein